MKKVLFLLCILTLSLEAASTDSIPVGQYRGYEAVQVALNERLLAPGQILRLDSYLQEDFAFNPNTILRLLGAHSEGSYVNGQPSSFSVLLWYLVFHGFASDMGKTCANAPNLPKWEKQFQENLKVICTWPAPEARKVETLKAFWSSIAFFDIDPEEFEQWSEFFLSPEFEKKTGKEVVYGMALTLLMHPQFLLYY